MVVVWRRLEWQISRNLLMNETREKGEEMPNLLWNQIEDKFVEEVFILRDSEGNFLNKMCCLCGGIANVGETFLEEN